LRGPTSKGKEGKERKGKGGENRYKREEKGKKGKGKGGEKREGERRRCAVGISNYFRLWMRVEPFFHF